MLHNIPKVAIFGGIGVAVILASLLSSTFFMKSSGSLIQSEAGPASTAPPADTADDAALDALIQAKGRIADIAARADPRVAQYTDRAFNIDQYFSPKEITGAEVDELAMRVVARQNVIGDWQTSQERTYSGVVDIKVSLDEGSVVDVEVTPVPDKKETVTFTDEEKAIIGAVMDNDSIKALLEGRDNVYVFTVYRGTYLNNPDYNCPPGRCAVVTISQENTKNTLHAWVNTSTLGITNIVRGKGWN